LKRRRILLDVVAIVVVAGIAFGAAASAYRSDTGPYLYQKEFGPAVMFALGKGLVNPQLVPGDAVEEFLDLRVPRLDPERVPTMVPGEFNQFQNSFRYLLIAAGLWWRLTDIAWAQLAGLAGLMHAGSVVATYMLIRLFAPAMPAAIGALWFALSPLPLEYAASLRDFSKAPFVLAAIPLILAAAFRLEAARSLVLASAMLGAIIGIGLGFRMDVVVMVPIGLASIVLFRGRYPWAALRQKAVAALVLTAMLTLTSWPVLSRMAAGGSNAFHFILLGCSEWFDTRLGVEQASYTLLPFYSDEYLINQLRFRSISTRGVDARMPSAGYDDIGREQWLMWVRHFPADVHTRLVSAINVVLNLPFRNPPAERAAGWFSWLNAFDGWGWAIGIGLLVAAARQALPLALLAALLLAALTGYPSLQFDPRHYFHLQAVPIAAIVAMTWAALAAAVNAARRRSLPAPAAWIAWRWPVLGALTVAALATAAPAAALRTYQAGHLRQVFGEVLRADREAMAVTFAPLGADRWLAEWDGASGRPSAVPGLRHAFYVAEFAATEPRAIMSVGLRYSEKPTWEACSLVRTLITSQGVARFAFPVYTHEGESRFEGLEMGSAMRQRLSGIYRVALPTVDLALELRLAPDWQSRRLYQRIVGEERYRADDTGAWVSPMDKCGAALRPIDATLDDRLAISGVESLAAGVVVDGGVIAFDADAGNVMPLAQLPPRQLQAGDALVARLWLDAGAVAIGLARNGIYVREEVATRPGASVIVVRVPEAGVYTPMIAAPHPGWRPRITFTIDRLGILPAAGDHAADVQR
jgi:hypothetical protein